MDKQGKLERYSRKDYSDNVYFPVEIIGRDGIVRQYSFEDSIRLYQRRVTFAAIRYRDSDLVDAELLHCRSRIEQLRRSYFYRFGWGTAEGEESPKEIFGELAGEVAAFIRRVLASADRVDAKLTCMEHNEENSVWYLKPLAIPGMILYVYDLRCPRADLIREEFFARLKDFEGTGRLGADSERLVAFHHGGDCAFSITARGEDFEQISNTNSEAADGSFDPSPIGEALRLLRSGRYECALRLCRERLQEFPWHKQGYYVASSIALHLGRRAEAEEMALLGSRFFPEDGEMLYRLGRVRLSDGRLDKGVEDLHAALASDPGHRGALVLLAVALLRGGRLSAAREVLEHGDGKDRELVTLGQWVQWRRLFGVLAVSLCVVGAFAVWTAGTVGLLPTATGFALLGMGWFAFSRFLEDVWKRELEEDPAHGNFHLHRDEARRSIS
jgi:hypothetical protein